MLYINVITRDGYNMSRPEFHARCEDAGYNEKNMLDQLVVDGWLYHSAMGLDLQDHIDLANPAEALKRREQ